MAHAGQSFRLACLSGENPGVFRPPAIERPSYGRGCNDPQVYAVLWAGHCVQVDVDLKWRCVQAIAETRLIMAAAK